MVIYIFFLPLFFDIIFIYLLDYIISKLIKYIYYYDISTREFP